MIQNVLRLIIIIILAVFTIYMVWECMKFARLRKSLGKKNGKATYLKSFKILGIKNKEGHKYKKQDALLLNAGWKISLEEFYIRKYLIAFVVMLCSLLVHETNIQIAINAVVENMDYGNRALISYQIPYTSEIIEKERRTIKLSKIYLRDINIDLRDPTAEERLVTFMNQQIDYYESPNIMASRILEKLKVIDIIEKDFRMYLFILVGAYMSFRILDALVYIKTKLLTSKKDWEAIHCMTMYSIVGRLPPFTVNAVIESIKDVAPIYSRTLDIFKKQLENSQAKALDETINLVDNEGIQEILETLVLANEIGVYETVENIDALLKSKINWIKIVGAKRRQTKFFICFILLVIVLYYIFTLFAAGTTPASLNQIVYT